MANTLTFHRRISDVILDRVLNPTFDRYLGGARPHDLIEACGIVPDFFCAACVEASAVAGDGDITLNDICDRMDALYGFGGFEWPMGGTIDHQGILISNHDDDADLYPIARFGFEGRVFCYVYDSGIVAVRVGLDGPYRIARFD